VPASKDLAIGVACQTRRRIRGQDDYNGPRYIAGRVGRHPSIVIFGSFSGCRRDKRSRRRVVGVVGLGGALLLFHLLVAFEVQGFGHIECCAALRCVSGRGSGLPNGWRTASSDIYLSRSGRWPSNFTSDERRICSRQFAAIVASVL
jgi:hypothetical protein